jgi:transposase|tara:strand:- start:223 stop:339 length:117 start_codon:yes stop_codon:yes gene_type:complete
MWEWILKKLKKTCPVCGHKNDINADKCSNCGADISDVK